MKEQEDDKFSIFIPLEIEKGGENSADKYSNMRFKGIASTTAQGRDSDGELLEVDGMDLDELITIGQVNYHHLWTEKPSAIIGEPTKAYKINKGKDLYIEGRLYPSSMKAREVYDLAEVLEKDSDSRRLGFSIEGKALSRDPKDKKRILKSKIVNVAITPMPKCKGTRMELMKGWGQDVEFEILKAETDNDGNTVEYLVDTTGQDGIRRTVDKAFNIKIWDINKAMTAGTITGEDTIGKELTQEPLKVSSLEEDKKKKKKKGQKLTKGETLIEIISTFKNINADLVKSVYELVEQIDMEITSETIQKAKELLGIVKGENTITLDTNTPAAADLSKAMSKEDALKMKADYKDCVMKAKEYMEKAEATKAALKEANMGDPDGDDSEILSHKKAEGELDIAKAIKENSESLIKSFEAKFDALALLHVESEEKNSELKKSLDEVTAKLETVSKTSTGPRSNFISKGVDRFTPSAAQDGEKQLSISKNKRQVIDELIKAADMSNPQDMFFKAASTMEIAGQLGRTANEANQIAQQLRTKNKIVLTA